MAGAEVLGMPHLPEEEFQVLAGHILIGREEVKPVIWPLGYLKGSGGGRWKSYVQHWDIQAQGKEKTGNSC